MFEVDDCVAFVTNMVSKQLSDTFNEKLSSYGVTRVQWIALYYLGKYKFINQSELAEKMNIKNSTMVRLIDRMEKEGYVQRIKDETDRRITNIALTELGIQRRCELLPVGESYSKLISKNIPADDLETFKSVLNKLVKNANLEDKL